jgi:hypothetical protein
MGGHYFGGHVSTERSTVFAQKVASYNIYVCRKISPPVEERQFTEQLLFIKHHVIHAVALHSVRAFGRLYSAVIALF